MPSSIRESIAANVSSTRHKTASSETVCVTASPKARKDPKMYSAAEIRTNRPRKKTSTSATRRANRRRARMKTAASPMRANRTAVCTDMLFMGTPQCSGSRIANPKETLSQFRTRMTPARSTTSAESASPMRCIQCASVRSGSQRPAAHISVANAESIFITCRPAGREQESPGMSQTQRLRKAMSAAAARQMRLTTCIRATSAGSGSVEGMAREKFGIAEQHLSKSSEKGLFLRQFTAQDRQHESDLMRSRSTHSVSFGMDCATASLSCRSWSFARSACASKSSSDSVRGSLALTQAMLQVSAEARPGLELR